MTTLSLLGAPICSGIGIPLSTSAKFVFNFEANHPKGHGATKTNPFFFYIILLAPSSSTRRLALKERAAVTPSVEWHDVVVWNERMATKQIDDIKLSNSAPK